MSDVRDKNRANDLLETLHALERTMDSFAKDPRVKARAVLGQLLAVRAKLAELLEMWRSTY